MTSIAPMTHNPDVDEYLFGSSRKGRSVSFPQVGATISGTICERPTKEQQRDPEGNLKTWDNGDPMWQVVVPLQTTLRTLEIENDDGVRYLFVDGSPKPESKSKHAALAAALRAVQSRLEIGGKLTMTYVADGAKTKAMYSAPKQYTAQYVPAVDNALMGEPVEQIAVDHVAKAPSGPVDGQGQPYPNWMSPEQVAGAQAANISAAQAAVMFKAS